jgi:hypothetical protein
MRKTEKTIWSFKYKNIICEIVFFTTEYMKNDLDTYKNGGIWNSYIYIKNDSTLFKKFLLELKDGFYGFMSLDIDFHGGVTFYEKIFNQSGSVTHLKIGNDFNHIWNGGEDLEFVKSELEKTIDSLIKQL